MRVEGWRRGGTLRRNQAELGDEMEGVIKDGHWGFWPKCALQREAQ